MGRSSPPRAHRAPPAPGPATRGGRPAAGERTRVHERRAGEPTIARPPTPRRGAASDPRLRATAPSEPRMTIQRAEAAGIGRLRCGERSWRSARVASATRRRIQRRRARGRQPVRQRRETTGYHWAATPAARPSTGADRGAGTAAARPRPRRRAGRAARTSRSLAVSRTSQGAREVVDQLGDLAGRPTSGPAPRSRPARRVAAARRTSGPRPSAGAPCGVGAGGEEVDAQVGLVAVDPGPGPLRWSRAGPRRLGASARLSSIGFTRPQPSERSRAAVLSSERQRPRSFDERRS